MLRFDGLAIDTDRRQVQRQGELLALAIATTVVFVLGGRAFFANGWQDFARPLLTDYLDRVAADLGSPPDVARAQALVERLPVAIRIEGPTVNWNSHPLRAEYRYRDALLRDLGQMRDQIADLLEGQRLAAGASALQTARCDVNALVRSAVADGFADKAVTLPITLSLADDLPGLMLDAVRLRLLLRNLLDNAVRHGGGAGIDVSTWREADALLLRVRDHGPGVPALLIPRLAEPFFRPDSARTRAAGGVGLGLYLSRLVAHSHGGSLDFANAEPGLAATLRLPLAAPP